MTTYHLATLAQDGHGVFRDQLTRVINQDELATLDLRQFQGAEDLPADVEFARGYDQNGNPIRVYRCHE